MMRNVLILLICLSFILGCTKTLPAPIDQPDIQEPIDQTPDVQPDEPNLPQAYDKYPEMTATLRTCNVESQCVKVSLGCCSCNYGGKAVALNKEYEQKWKDTLDQTCTDVACPAVMSNDASCQMVPKCIKNKCTLAPFS